MIPFLANEDGSMADIQQMDSDQHLQWLGWQDILNSLKPEGIGDRHILVTIAAIVLPSAFFPSSRQI